MANLTIRPAEDGYEEVYQNLLDNITPGTQWDRAAVTVPFTNGAPTTFLIDGNQGDTIEVTLNGVVVTRTVLQFNQNEIKIQLQKGKNFIRVSSGFDSYVILIVAVHYAIFQKAWAKQYYAYVQSRVDETARQLNSRFSLRAVEHQIEFQELLPPTRAFRILAGKLAIRSLINETGTTRGVNDIATAISNTTPVVVPTQVDMSRFEPSVYTLYDRSHDQGGFEFNIWVPNIQAAIWPAFIKLVENLDDSVAKLVSVTDNRVVVEYDSQLEQHLFDLDDPSSDIVNIITDLLDCFYNITLTVKETSVDKFAFCYWYYGSDHVTTVPMVADASDPASDGWLHESLSPPLDSGIPFDIGPNISLFEDIECHFSPMTIQLNSSLAEIPLRLTSTVTAIGTL